jgi:tRNA (guanine37-N1)-methyltransferase
MVLCAKVSLKKAEEVKQFIIDNSLFHPDYYLKKSTDFIFFPVKKKGGLKKNFSFVEFQDVDCVSKTKRPASLKTVIQKDLSKKELSFLRRAFDTIGSIAVLEIPEELREKEKPIAGAILKINKNIKTVLKKAGIHETEFRTQKMVYLAGKRTKETVHKEHNTRIKLNVETVYFSPRLATERKRIADQVRPGESILVMFSGCAPYPCVIAKTTKAKEITGIELNPEGHKYALENTKLNKIKNITLFNGDVAEIVPRLKKKFDRIIMPLPKSAGDFLDTAFHTSKPGTIVHFYAFEEEGKFNEAHKRIKSEAKKHNIKYKILKTIKCGQQSPKTFRICVDFEIK